VVIISQYFLLSFYNSDALGFYDKVINFNWSNIDLLNTDSNIFVIWNKIIFLVFGNRIWVSQIFSVLSWVYSFHVLKNILDIILIKKNERFLIYLIFSLLPSCIIYTSGFLREAYELLFCNILILYCLLVYKKPTFLRIMIILISAILLFLLHEVYLIVLLSLFFLLLHFIVIKTFRNKLAIYTYLSLFIISSLFVFNLPMIKEGIELHSIGIENTGEFRANYINYDYKFNILIRTIQFLFEPLPFRNLNFNDLIAIFENLFKLIFLTSILIYSKSLKYNIPFILFVFITTAWSMFTYNWGTSIRHQVPQLGLLLAAYAYSKINRAN
jgi:hypothetical protein